VVAPFNISCRTCVACSGLHSHCETMRERGSEAALFGYTHAPAAILHVQGTPMCSFGGRGVSGTCAPSPVVAAEAAPVGCHGLLPLDAGEDCLAAPAGTATTPGQDPGADRHTRDVRAATTTPSRRPRAVSNDAIVVLKDDHQQIRKLFRDFQDAGEYALKKKAKIVEKIIEALTVHTFIENEGMYPAVRTLLPALEDHVLESFEEHHVADVLCMELAAMSPDDERFTAKTTVLIENVTHHIEEEETEWFPRVREGLGRKELQEIGTRLLELREEAPRRPEQPGALKKVADAVLS
jgi:hemerythrin-like domain-containing protein